MSEKIEAKDELIKSKIRLNKTAPFYSYILMNMNIEKTETNKNCPTMAINKYGDLFWSEEFVNKLTVEEIDFVLMHEASHVSTLTFTRQGVRNMTLWNIATDLVINYMLIKDGYTPPKDILVTNSDGNYILNINMEKKTKKIIIEVKDKIAEEVYDQLEKNIKDVLKELENGDGKGGYKGGLDTHLEGGKDPSGNSQNKNDETIYGETANENNWKKKAIEASTAAKMRGKTSTIMEREIDQLLTPMINWKKKLYQFITKELPIDYSMKKPGRRTYSVGYYTPSIIKENLEVLIGVDNSGSTLGDYTRFISEVVGIGNGFNQIKIRLIFWACSVDEHDDIVITRNNTDYLTKFKPKNTGGTELSCFTNYCNKKGYKAQINIILTDGEIETTPRLPSYGKTLFVLTHNGNPNIVKKYGEVCKLNKEIGTSSI